MQNTRLDVIELLKKEKEWHFGQIKKIDIMLSAINTVQIKGTESKSAKSKMIPWKSEIMKILKSGNAYTTNQIKGILYSQGIKEAHSTSGLNSIYATLSRLKKEARIIQLPNRSYKIQ